MSKARYCAYGEHQWGWNEELEAWQCGLCHDLVLSTDGHIEPCITCGREVDADAVYCEACLSEDEEAEVA